MVVMTTNLRITCESVVDAGTQGRGRMTTSTTLLYYTSVIFSLVVPETFICNFHLNGLRISDISNRLDLILLGYNMD